MKDKVRVLVVDDSAFARVTISKALESDPKIEVVGKASDGLDSIEQVKNLKPDVVTMDVTMPRMDGIEAVGRIMSECPTPVVMLSATTGENSAATLDALDKGAVDFFLKPSALSPAGLNGEAAMLLDIVKTAAEIPSSRLRAGRSTIRKRRAAPPAKPKSTRVKTKTLLIGSSTGGPRALGEVIPLIPKDIPASIMIVQHMPAGFTKSLADRLNNSSEIRVKEAAEGDLLETGVALLAPGGYHMVVEKNGRIVLNESPPVCGVRPSVDVTLESAVNAYGKNVKAVILTGMGSDGTNSCEKLKKAGGSVVVQNEETCAVYGMPKSVVDAGYADSIVPLNKITDEIIRMCYE